MFYAVLTDNIFMNGKIIFLSEFYTIQYLDDLKCKKKNNTIVLAGN